MKVAVGLSGGVDSSVSAYLLKEQGYDVTGVYMQCWDARADGCSAEEDRADAVKVAAHLRIPFKHLDFINEYKTRVIKHFYNEYQAGRTPNPDVLCNKEIKFGIFLDWALENGFDFVATGHYARVQTNDGKCKLLTGLDNSKDQSYFLYLLDQKKLSHALFPIGALSKNEVREIAQKVGFHNFSKPDSVGICFIGEVDMKSFLKGKIQTAPGSVVDKTGETIGTHDGVQFYTIGQRHGFKVEKYFGLPLYVIGKNPEKNELVVGFAKDGLRESFEVGDVHWIGSKPDDNFECCVRIRHLGEMYLAHCTFIKEDQQGKGGALELNISNNNSKIQVNLVDSIFGIAPGQSAVFYVGEVVLGGGIIL
ncbi:tRNA 2-thiouridine(34) synthase MnmA [candidate division WWE3 bacterium]|nr:tRNA 2-thiouridine(34) synthase MnmA [candidate division WWE3 bacterium]